MHILLVNPSWGAKVSKKGNRYNRSFPPTDLLTIGALLREAQHTVELFDANLHNDTESLVNIIKKSDFVILTSSPYYKWQCPNLNYKVFLSFAQIFPKDKTILYGAHISQYPDFFMKKTGFKYGVTGEPEFAILSLLKKISTNTLSLKNGYHIEYQKQDTDLNKLPIPAFDLLTYPKQYAYEVLGNKLISIESSRGCPYQCIYCYKEMYGKHIRKKSVDRVLKEITNALQHGFKRLYIYDLEFMIHRDLVMGICNGIINKGLKVKWTCQGRADSVDEEMLTLMKKSGCMLIHYGVESGSNRVLDILKKNTTTEKLLAGFKLTKKAKIESAAFFMFGFPDETDEERDETIDFAIKLNPDYASFHIASIYPQTEFYNIFLKNGGNKSDLYPEYLNTDFVLKDLEAIKKRAYKKFYFRPAYIFKRLFKGSPKNWIKQFSLFLKFLK